MGKPPTAPIAFILCLGLLIGCGKREEDYLVKGAHLLANDAADDATAYDILAYPINEEEMRYFVDNVGRFAAALADSGQQWNRLQFSERPMRAIRDHPVWRETGLSSEDFMAAFAKLDFLQGYAEDPTPPSELSRAAAQLERRYEQGGPDSELEQAILTQRRLAKAAEAAGPAALALYAENRGPIDRALDRFRSIGE